MKYQDQSYYHVYNRGAHKENIFYSDDHYLRCLDLLEKYSQKYSVSIIAYCLMPNHYHLVIRQNENGSISRCIQTTFNAYSQTVNLIEQQSGTLFQGKAKAKQIDSESSLIQVIRYVHLNPVRAGIVQRPEDWHFSDYRNWILSPSDDLGLPSEGHGRSELTFGRLSMRETYFANAEDYKQFVEEYQTMQKENDLQKFLFDEK